MVEIRLFGPLQFQEAGRPITLQSRKAAALLAYLILTGRRETRPFLVELFWPELTERRGRANLSWALNHLRKHLPGCLTADFQSVAFQPEQAVDVDAVRFQQLAQSGGLTDLQTAVNFARGELLAGFALDDCPEFELWLAAEREQWRQRVTDVTLLLVRGCRENGDYTTAIEYARRLLGLAPWREAAHRELIWLLALTGHRTAALEQYERCREVLVDELGIAPTDETVQLAAQIEAGELKASLQPPAIYRPTLPPQPETPFFGRTAELAQIEELLLSANCRLLTIFGIGGTGKTRLAVEAGHRLAGHFSDGAAFISLAALDKPEQITAVIGDGIDFRPKASENEPPASQLNQFLAGKLLLLLLDNFEHLLGGVPLILGILAQCPEVKIIVTSRVRLNVQAETILHLGGLDGETAEGENNAVSLFLERARRVQPGLRPTTAEMAAINRLTASVGGHPLAIELAAAQLNVATIDSIVAETAESIESLRVTYADFPERHHSIEAVFDLSWQSLSPAAKVALGRLSFCQGGCTPKAAQALTGVSRAVFIELVNQALIQLVDGRYHMHELLRHFAKARLTTEQVEEARKIHSDFYLRWFDEVGAGLSGPDQRRILAKVQADFENIRHGWRWLFISPKHLANAAVEVNRLCWLFRNYFQRQGDAMEGAAVFAAAAEAVYGRPEAGQLAAVLRAFEIIQTPVGWLPKIPDETLQAYQEAFAHRSEQIGGAALFHLALGYSYLLDGDEDIATDRCRRQLEKSVSLYQAAGDEEKSAVVRFLLARRLTLLGDNMSAIEQFQACLATYRRRQDIWGEARTLEQLGRTRYGIGDFEGAEMCLIHCRELNRELDFGPGIAFSTRWLGNVATARGQYEKAHARYLQALELEQGLGDLYQIGRCYNNLGVVCKNMGEYKQAEHWYQQSLATFEGLHNGGLTAMVYNNLGMLFEAQGRYEKALALIEKGLALRLSHGGRIAAIDDYINMGVVLTALKQYDPAQSYLLEALKLSLASGRESLILETLMALARLHARQDRPEQAARLARLTLGHPAAEHLTKEGAKDLLNRLAEVPPAPIRVGDLRTIAADELEELSSG